MSTHARWRGLKALTQTAVTQASVAIERIQKESARRPFAVLALFPQLAAPARTIHLLHDAAVSGVHGAIRLVTRAVGGTVDALLDAAEAGGEATPEAQTGSSLNGSRNDVPR